jgi:FKBP-type peptidyl-prolyl cis-trans isomerase (trigger factor)
MAIDIQKPAPLALGDRYYYTLTSYEPVAIEVEVPLVTDADVDMAVRSIAAERGVTPEQMTDEWIKANLDGAESLAQVRDAVRSQLAQMNQQLVDSSKPAKAAEELAKRLVQAVPADEVARYREGVRQQFEMELAEEGLTRETFLSSSGASPASLEHMFDQEAKTAAEQSAALDAYAQEKKLSIDDTEIPGLLRLPPKDAAQLIDDARAHGQIEQLRQAAVRNKAAQVVTAEASCSYHHETAEEAKARIAQYEALEQFAAARQDAEPPAEPAAESGFKLV